MQLQPIAIGRRLMGRGIKTNATMQEDCAFCLLVSLACVKMRAATRLLRPASPPRKIESTRTRQWLQLQG